MGGCVSSPVKPPAARVPVHPRAIDAKDGENAHKLLLLGCGESGKSTSLKILSELFRPGGGGGGAAFSDSDRRLYIPIIYDNIRSAMLTLIKQLRSRHTEFDAATEATVQLLENLPGASTRGLSDYRGSASDHKQRRGSVEASYNRNHEFVPRELAKLHPNAQAQYDARVARAPWFSDEDGSRRGLNARTVYGVYIAPVAAHEKMYYEGIQITTGMADSHEHLLQVMQQHETWQIWRQNEDGFYAYKPYTAPSYPQPDLTRCCDNFTLRHVLRAIFTSAPFDAAATDPHILPALPLDLLPIIADYTTGSLGQLIHQLWCHPAFQQMYHRRAEYQLTHNARFFFDRILSMTTTATTATATSSGQPPQVWVPCAHDIARSRLRTSGIVEVNLKAFDESFKIYDVGGQRGERKKWIHCFENVSVVWMVVAASEFDQVLYEDETMNRMEESLVLWREISNSRWFAAHTDVMLIFTKTDSLREKLDVDKRSVAAYFPEYTGNNSYESVMQFFRAKFAAVQGRCDLVAEVNGLDHASVRDLMERTRKIAITRQLREAGLLEPEQTGQPLAATAS